MVSDPIVGIDLGTSNSMLAVADEAGVPRILADTHGHEIQPSVISFHPSGAVLVGARAKQRRVIDPQNTVYSAKRLIGRTFDSREVSLAAERVSFTIKKGVNQQPVVVSRAGEFSVPEVTGIVLDHMRGLARQRLGVEVNRAVVAVPANFTDAQRSATVMAGQIAGLEIVQAINEPTAAALAYGDRRSLDSLVAVYDFGGGTFDVTLLQVKGSVYEVLATAGDPFLGGDDIDERVAATLVERFETEHGIDLRSDVTAMQRLRSVSEQIKVELSRRPRAMAQIDKIATRPDGTAIDFIVRIAREELEREVVPILARSFAVCQQALKMAGLTADQIQDVILVGGTSKMPLVRARVGGFFATEPRIDVSPDAAVALGAALHGHSLRRSLGDPVRRDTARGAVVPPAPPMEARGRIRAGQQRSDDWNRGSTIPRLTPWEGIERPELSESDEAETGEGMAIALDTVDVSPSDRGPAAGYRQPQPGGRDYVALGDARQALPTTPGGNPSVAFSPPEPAPAATLLRGQDGGAPVPRVGSTTLPGGIASLAGAAGTRPPEASQTLLGRDIDADRLRSPGASQTIPGAGGEPIDLTGVIALADEPEPEHEAESMTATLDLAALSIEDNRSNEPTGARPLDDFDMMAASTSPASPSPAVLNGGQGVSGLAPTDLSVVGSGPAIAASADVAATIREVPSSRSGPNMHAHSADAGIGVADQPFGDAIPQPMTPAPIILDVTPYSLGVGTVAGYCRSLLERNSRVPAEIQEIFTTSKNAQQAVRIQVCQGESHRLDENTVLGDLILSGIEPRPRGETRIEVTFHINESGILHVRACDLRTGQEQEIDFQLIAVPSKEEVATSTQRLRALQIGDVPPS